MIGSVQRLLFFVVFIWSDKKFHYHFLELPMASLDSRVLEQPYYYITIIVDQF